MSVLRFDLEHYSRAARRRPRRAATASRFFEGEPADGDLILRHDVDLSLDAALRMAELEANAGARRDVLPDDAVGLLQPRLAEGEHALARLRELGHRVGLHAV